MKPEKFLFTLENLADLICEYTKDGAGTRDRDVVKWFRWFERKCGIEESYIASTAELMRRKRRDRKQAHESYQRKPKHRARLVQEVTR